MHHVLHTQWNDLLAYHLYLIRKCLSICPLLKKTNKKKQTIYPVNTSYVCLKKILIILQLLFKNIYKICILYVV